MDSQDKEKLTFHYIKSPQYRVSHADGAHGGITPPGKIQMNFYSERTPIPQTTFHEINEDRSLGAELEKERIGKTGIIREIDTTIIIDINTAKNLVEWLNQKIQTIEAIYLQEKKGGN